MNRKNNHLTPERITKLSRCEIFVFGSNVQGEHMGGATKIAYEKFGAEWGVGDGPTGRCYAIPTMHGGLEDIRPYAEKFIEYAKEHPRNRFLLTRVGCGIAGFKDIDMSQLFRKAVDIPNIAVPKEWLPGMLIDTYLGIDTPKEREISPETITEQTLMKLCQKHNYEIGAGIFDILPNIRVRYVEENQKFGYREFGDFFFHKEDFYVWSLDDKWADQHNQGIVLDVFGDECEGRGYARKVLFAGVCTNVRDINKELIYTGDVINIIRKDPTISDQLALGTFDTAEEFDYRFVLDNHSLLLSDCIKQNKKLQRIGTVFFQLKDDEYPPKTIRNRTGLFNSWYDTGEEHKQKVLMSKYTPNFDQEIWKYTALDLLGVEFNWR